MELMKKVCETEIKSHNQIGKHTAAFKRVLLMKKITTYVNELTKNINTI